ncbi:MAG: CGNR zinc finger domain-containing protein [Candidatus Neomarinimicrobiota bacterium]
MLGANKDQSSLNLESGWLCLEYANTLDWHASDNPVESIHNYEDLVQWFLKVGIISDKEKENILKKSVISTINSSVIYTQAINLRENIYGIFSAIAGGTEPFADDLDKLNILLPDIMNHLQIKYTSNSYSWAWSNLEESPDQILWPLARSAASLLTSPDRKRVGECADDRGCGWLFLDTSKNKSRRWCDMRNCGNRNKVRKYYQKKRIMKN